MKFGKLQQFNIPIRFVPLKTKTIRAYPVLDTDLNIDLMIHRDYNAEGTPRSSYYGWKVSECTTGQRVHPSDTCMSREEAVIKTLKHLSQITPAMIAQCISDAPKINGVNPCT